MRATRTHFVDERRHMLGQSCSAGRRSASARAPCRVEVADVSLQHAPIVQSGRRSHGHPHQPFRDYRVQAVEVVALSRLRIGVVRFHSIQSTANTAEGRFDNLLRKLRILPLDKG